MKERNRGSKGENRRKNASKRKKRKKEIEEVKENRESKIQVRERNATEKNTKVDDEEQQQNINVER